GDNFVSTIPGDTFVILTPVRANSFSRPCEIARTANLVALYTVFVFVTSNPETEAILIICTDSFAIMSGISYVVPLSILLILIYIILLHLAISYFVNSNFRITLEF